MTLIERFQKKVSPEPMSGCHLWTGAVDGGGYGRIYVNGFYRGAHQLGYELAKGPIPKGMELDHLCRIRCCVNPHHLEPVTTRENTSRSSITLASLNRAKTHCPAGHLYDSANTFPQTRGGRGCKACRQARDRKRDGLRRRQHQALDPIS